MLENVGVPLAELTRFLLDIRMLGQEELMTLIKQPGPIMGAHRTAGPPHLYQVFRTLLVNSISIPGSTQKIGGATSSSIYPLTISILLSSFRIRGVRMVVLPSTKPGKHRWML
jgi:hypothetical protein